VLTVSAPLPSVFSLSLTQMAQDGALHRRTSTPACAQQARAPESQHLAHRNALGAAKKIVD